MTWFYRHEPVQWNIFTMTRRNVFLNKLDILFYNLAKTFLYLVIKHKKAYTYLHNFSVSCIFSFSSSGTHQSHQRDGCQAIGITSSFIEAFWAFCF